MTKAAQSVFYFSWYLLLAGAAVFLFPNLVLPSIGLATSQEPWVRVVGAFTFILGIFFYQMSRANITAFFRTSLYGRGTFIVAVLILTVFFKAPLPLLLFAAVDLLGFVWTYTALKK